MTQTIPKRNTTKNYSSMQAFIERLTTPQKHASLLHSAIFYNKIALALSLLGKPTQKDIHKIDEFGHTPLQYTAIYDRNINIAKRLIEQGANCNDLNIRGSTPLHFAAGMGNARMVKLLIEEGADPYFKNKEGQTALDYANKLRESARKSSFIDKAQFDTVAEILESHMQKTNRNKTFTIKSAFISPLPSLSFWKKGYTDERAQCRSTVLPST
jgi:ankyrin repeat protein